MLKQRQGSRDFTKALLLILSILSALALTLWLLRTKPEQKVEAALDSSQKRIESKAWTRELPSPSARRTVSEESDSAAQPSAIASIRELVDQGEWMKAEGLLQILLQAEPHHEAALMEMSMIQLLDKQDLAQAQVYLQKAMQLNPDNDYALQELLGVYEELKLHDQGLNFLLGLAEREHESGALEYGVGISMIKLGKKQEGLSYLQRAVYEKAYRDFAAREALAEAYTEGGRLEDAIREWQAMSEGNFRPPQIRLAKTRLASALMENKQWQESRQILEQLAASDPQDEWVSSLLADLKVRQRF